MWFGHGNILSRNPLLFAAHVLWKGCNHVKASVAFNTTYSIHDVQFNVVLMWLWNMRIDCLDMSFSSFLATPSTRTVTAWIDAHENPNDSSQCSASHLTAPTDSAWPHTLKCTTTCRCCIKWTSSNIKKLYDLHHHITTGTCNQVFIATKETTH